jgi:hypothetical protein
MKMGWIMPRRPRDGGAALLESRPTTTWRPGRDRWRPAAALRAVLAVVAIVVLSPVARAQTAPCVEIVLRSGQSGGVPGAPGQPDDLIRRHPTTVPVGQISATPFGAAWFAAAQAGGPATVTARNPGWINPATGGFPCDPQARWISHRFPSQGSGSSAFYAVPFDVGVDCIERAEIEFCWAADETLGDLASGPNPNGVYINGVALPITGGSFTSPSTITVPVTGLAAGQNWLYIYTRNVGTSDSGLLFSARLRIWCCPEPCVRINLRSGQVGGAPGSPGQNDGNVRRHPMTVPVGAISATPFTPAWFAASQATPATITARNPGWINPATGGFPCDPLARWISHRFPSQGSGSSAFYAIPFDVDAACVSRAELDFCWAADETLGDVATGPNPSGVYLNGVPLPISGGSFGAQSQVLSLPLTNVVPGQNWLYIYTRNVGTSDSGLLFSAQVRVFCCPAGSSCVTPPRNMVLWMPFEEPGGSSTTANILRNPTGNGTLQAGAFLANPGAVDRAICFDQGQVDVGSYPALALDNDLTIDAWIDMWSFTISRQHTIVDKRQFSTSFPTGWRGYRFYIDTGPSVGGPMKLEMSDGSATFTATGPSVPLGPWQHVAVMVDRHATGPGGIAVTFAYNGACSPPFTLPPGSLNGLMGIAATRIGDTFDQTVPNQWFGGCMDELEIFSQALGCGEIAAIFNAGADGKCKEFCQVDWDRSFYRGDTSIMVPAFICNNTSTPQTYNLTINPYTCPFSSTASPVGITTNPVSPITVPAYGCSTVWLTIPRPPFSGVGDVSCYEICMTNIRTGVRHCCQGSVQDSGSIFVDVPFRNPGALGSGRAEPFMMPITNPGGTGVLLPFRVRVIGPDMLPDTTTISLDGLAPGTPIEGELDLPAGATVDLEFTAAFTLDDAGQWYSILLEIDLDGDGTFEAIESVSVVGGMEDPCPPVIADNFEFYIPGMEPCGINGWQAWSGSTDVCGLVTTELAASGMRSLKLVGAVGGSTGAGDDVVQAFNLTSGRHVLRLNTYIPVGTTGRGWVVLLSEYPAPFNWALNLMLDADAGVIRDEQDAMLSRPLELGRWVEVMVVVDLDADTVDAFYDGVQFIAGKSWTLGVPPSGPATFKALDIYADEPGGRGITAMYVDDVSLRTECDAMAEPCLADCDGDGTLNIFDFLCFQNQFAAGDPRADLDGDGTLTIFDFLAFQNLFAAGCP